MLVMVRLVMVQRLRAEMELFEQMSHTPISPQASKQVGNKQASEQTRKQASKWTSEQQASRDKQEEQTTVLAFGSGSKRHWRCSDGMCAPSTFHPFNQEDETAST